MAHQGMTLAEATDAAEAQWLERFTRGPEELTVDHPPQSGDNAPDGLLFDETGRKRPLSDAWAGGPALVVFWRHYGCGCGIERAERMRREHDDLARAGCAVVAIGMGEPVRTAAYREAMGLPCPMLSDSSEDLYRLYGLAEWQPAQVLYDAPAEFLLHPRELGTSFAASRREGGRPLVDNPWRQTGEFLVTPDGRVQLTYRYQYCEDYPDPRIWLAALASLRAENIQATSPRLPRVAAST